MPIGFSIIPIDDRNSRWKSPEEQVNEKKKRNTHSTITLTYLEQRSMTLILEKSSREEEEEMNDECKFDRCK